ncbi:hypothetical protein Bca4012_032159 [Brassica carinata]
MAMKQNGKAPVSSDSEERVMLFKDVSLGLHAAQLRFRLIHFWEARNLIKKTLIGLEMLLIDEQVSRFFKNSSDTLRSIFTENFKRTLALTSMSSTWVFMDYDVQPTKDYFTWLGSTQRLLSRLVRSACHSKATKGATSLICTNTRCGKVNTTGVAQYCAKISVYDNSEQAFFILLGDAGRELTGRHASELVNSYFEANKNEGPDHEVPVPEALINTIGQTHKFCVKVIEHNLSGNTRAITVTKILSLDTPPPTEASVGNNIAATSEETMQTGNELFEPSKSRGDSANEESKRTSASADPEKSKRNLSAQDVRSSASDHHLTYCMLH